MRFAKNIYHHIDASQLKDRIDPKDFYNSEEQEVETGSRGLWKSAGLCPFHSDRNKGNFFILVDGGAFKCFSCGAKGNDIIAFVMQKYELSFRKALEKLAMDWRVS